MHKTEQKQRAAVVAEAMTWLNTPYHHQGNVKGAGADCAFLLIRVFHACGLIPDIDPRPYPMDWHLHRGEERYLRWVEEYARPVETPQPGDIVVYKFGRCISHGAIVIDWPTILHAYVGEGVVLTDAENTPRLQGRQAGFYSIWEE
ncbi:hydrolase [Chromobacterium sp. LK1]|uniref:C40 family peptidase n=1 Tax=Chromobacterium sp. LK1 TaxID=1628193 RepID=UPI0006529A26|nr:NlpC/P60 family protein [Chromobacterium sp. LK1]KMN36525.1 hydrolase [Chromobacterium sp. LK1]